VIEKVTAVRKRTDEVASIINDFVA